MDEFKKTVAANIAKLRGAMGLTQAQLGEKLNYSDKSVSKWERGESVPEAFVLKQIADMAGVTVDYILSPDQPDADPIEEKPDRRYSRRFVTLTVLAGIWALAVLVFVILWLTGIVCWLVYVSAVPVSLITLLVLNSVWGDHSWNLYIVSGLVWSIIALVYLAAIDQNWWQIFLLGIPAQFIIVFAFSIRKKPNK